MEQYENNGYREPQDGYQLPPNVVMNGAGAGVLAPQAPPVPQPAPMPVPPTRLYRPIAPSVALQPTRPLWYPFAIIGAIAAPITILGLSAIVAGNSNQAIVKASMDNNTAAVMEGMKNRTDFAPVCVISCFGMDVNQAAAAYTGQPAPQPVQPAPVRYASAVAIDGAGLNIYNGDRVINTIPAGDKLRVIQVDRDYTLVDWVASNLQGWVKSQGVQQ